MKHADQKSGVMKIATNAATRTEGWSSAKQAFAQRVSASGSFGSKSVTARKQDTAASRQNNPKK